ncbi:thiamine pyrophosphate-binding protein [Plesiomonas shigelloides]|uniref:thiamine pyrophosphate-binding protein n=1 Tax=Plesiomonas shigelloides TaxID=703 RepID=UPI002FCC610F
MNNKLLHPAADAILEFLSRKGIDTLHNYPGGTIAPMLDACQRFNTKIFTARTEQGAGYAALAYAKLHDKPGVVAVTSGPGVTNVITCVADAYFDSYPMLVFSGQVSTSDLIGVKSVRQSGFQEVNTPELMKTITKAQFQPKSALELSEILPLAWEISMSGRKGPVSIDLPMNVQRENISYFFNETVSKQNDIDDISIATFVGKLIRSIEAAVKPVIICGKGMVTKELSQQLRDIIEIWPCPVSHSLLGIGAIPSDHILNLGFHGHTGSQVAGAAITESDLVIVLGSRLDVRQTGTLTEKFAPNATIFRVEFDDAEITHSRISSNHTIKANLELVIPSLLKKLKDAKVPNLEKWQKRIAKIKKQYPWPNSNTNELSPINIIKSISSNLQNPVICTTGVGSHQHWTARHFNFDYPARQLFTSAGHGAMGFDLPTAIGMAYHSPDSTVLCIVGDGSIQMNIQELALISELNLNIKIIVIDNKRLALVSQFQLMNWSNDTSCGNKAPVNYSLIANAYGIKSIKIKTRECLEEKLLSFLSSKEPVLIHIPIDDKFDIIPMLLGGQSMDKMWPYYDVDGNLMEQIDE